MIIMLSMEILARIFGGEIRVKIMKLFLFNQERFFTSKEVVDHIGGSRGKIRKELLYVCKMGLIRKKTEKKKPGYIVNTHFAYLTELHNFLMSSKPLKPSQLIKKFSKAGSVKLILTSGVFMKHKESRVDLLIVGDGMRMAKLEGIIKNLESDMGKEIRYACFTTEEFRYRISMYDKLTRDILDYPHNKVLNKLGIE